MTLLGMTRVLRGCGNIQPGQIENGRLGPTTNVTWWHMIIGVQGYFCALGAS